MTEQIIMVVLLAIALAMDAFAVAMTLGMSGLAKMITAKMKIAFTFGFFQAIMFLLGYYTLFILGNKITKYNSLISGLLLAFLGVKMILDSFDKVEAKCTQENCIHCRRNKCLNTGEYRFLNNKILLIYGTATSIDSYAAGVSYGLKYSSILYASLTIGLITFLFSFLGVNIGLYVKKYIGKKATILGGIILIILAIKSVL
ncbi:MAG TPA: manganese efflux pump [Haloplasmataceae bacterium]